MIPSEAWLPTPPDGWDLVRVRRIATVETGSKDTVNADEDGEYPFFVRSPEVQRISTYSYDTEAILTPGDGDVGRIFHHVTGRFDVHQRVYVFRDFKAVIPRFFYYWMLSQFHHRTDQGTAMSTVASLRRPMIVDFPVLRPPTVQQRAIADFLDRETAQIEAMIAAQRDLVVMLQERRLGAINAILAAAPGVQRTPLGRVVSIQAGVTLGKSYEGEPDLEEYPYLRVANVQTGYVSTDDLTTIKLPAKEARRSLLHAGDVLITEGGDRTALARGSLWHGQVAPCLHQNHIYALRPDSRRLVAEYLVYVLEGSEARRYFEGTRRQTTNLSATNSSLVRAFRFTLPDIADQREMVDRLDQTTGRMDAMIEAVNDTIALMQERRTALISAAVTGRIDPYTGQERPVTEEVS